jgi:hypothetical protein
LADGSGSKERRETGKTPFAELEPPGASSTGLTGEQRREAFLDGAAVEAEVDIQKNLDTFGCDLSLIEFPEWQRTKHVHRLHPYLGKYIPQLVELFLRRFFEAGQTVLDPFAGSGTTLVEANPLGIHAVGFELSPFNCLIERVKTQPYDVDALGGEVADARERLERFAARLDAADGLPDDDLFRDLPPPEELVPLETDSEYLHRWIAPTALQQVLFYRQLLERYPHRDVLRVILSRVTRSVRLIPHYDLARPKEPLQPGQEYWCVKHNRTCRPVEDALKFFRRYSRDTVKRIAEYDELRTDAAVTIIEGDARTADLPEGTMLHGVFTSPPYVGMIDYHEQHRYAYELFPDLERRDEQEIGPMALGKSKKARAAYQEDMAAVFRNIRPHLRPEAKVFVVANDKHDLYPAIGEMAGLRLVDTFHRPVPMRTERDSRTYFESIFWFEPAG